nr:DUF5677 domain-containing protein [uncultured Pedobacter sp.]
MEELERIRNLDDEIFQEFQEYFPKIKSCTFSINCPTTFLLFNMYDTSSTFIKNTIFDCCETDDYYGLKILYRCLIEHFFKFKFIFLNYSELKTDEFSKEYFDYGNAREVLDLLKAEVSEQQLFNSNFKLEKWDNFLNEHPRFGNKTRKQVEEETKKYAFKNTVFYLNKKFKDGNLNMSQFLGKLIVEYSNLSSFVHGGMKSYNEMMFITQTERELEYDRIAGSTFVMSNNIKLLSLMIYLQTDRDKLTSHYIKIEKILKKINPT